MYKMVRHIVDINRNVILAFGKGVYCEIINTEKWKMFSNKYNNNFNKQKSFTQLFMNNVIILVIIIGNSNTINFFLEFNFF